MYSLILIGFFAFPNTVYADSNPPSMEIVSGDPTTKTEPPYKVKVKFTDVDGIAQITSGYGSLNGMGNKSVTFTFTVTTNGTYQISVEDMLGNKATYSITITNLTSATNDTTPPTIEIISGNPAHPTSGTVEVKFRITDNVGIGRIECNGTEDNANGITIYNYSYLCSENQTVNLTVYDFAGNKATASVNVTNIVAESIKQPTQSQTESSTPKVTEKETKKPTEKATEKQTETASEKITEKNTEKETEEISSAAAIIGNNDGNGGIGSNGNNKASISEKQTALINQNNSNNGNTRFSFTYINTGFYVTLLIILSIGFYVCIYNFIKARKRFILLNDLKMRILSGEMNGGI